MEKFQRIMEKSLIPISSKLSGNKYLRAVSGGFSYLLPIILVGAIASLLSGLSFTSYQTFITNTGLKEIISWTTATTTNMIALYASMLIAYSLAKQLECKDHALIVAITALFAFLFCIPLGVTATTEAGDIAINASAISVMYFGSPGLFTAMIIGVTVPTLYNLFIKHEIVIKMPEGVPPQIANGFSAILPVLFVAILFSILRLAVAQTSFGTINDLVYGLLRAPLSSLSQSPWTFILLLVMCNLLWWFGIHGGMVVMPFISMLYMAPAMENLDALAAGTAMPNLLTNTWWFTFCQIGANALGLAICMTFFAKSKRYKTLGKIAILPAVCGIGEPMVFGAPIMMNVMLFIPYLLSPIICFVLSYLLTVAGVLPYLNGMQLSTGTPVLLAGLLTGGWRAALWQLVLVVIQVSLFFPFFKIIDKQAVQEEELLTTGEV